MRYCLLRECPFSKSRILAWPDKCAYLAQAKCSSKAKKLEDEIAEKQAELEAVQQDRAAQEAAHEALVKDIADTERRLQVPSLCHFV